jgi:hypothetical protein
LRGCTPGGCRTAQHCRWAPRSVARWGGCGERAQESILSGPMQGRSEKIGPERSSPHTKHMGDYYFSLYTSFHRYTQSLDLYCERPSVSSAVDIQTGCILQDGLAEHSRYQPKASSYMCSVLFTGMIGNARSLAHLACRAEGPRVDPRNNRRRLSTPDTPPRKIRPAFTAYISQGGG